MSDASPSPNLSTLPLLWGVLLVSQVVYVVVGSVVEPVGTGDMPEIFPWLLGAASLGLAAAAHFSWRRATGAGRAVHEPGPGAPAAFTGRLIAWVLDEAVAMLGLVMMFLGYPLTMSAPFSLAAFALMFAHRPFGDGSPD